MVQDGWEWDWEEKDDRKVSQGYSNSVPKYMSSQYAI